MVVKDVIEEPKPLKEMLVAEPRDVACQSPKRPKPPTRKFGRDALTVSGQGRLKLDQIPQKVCLLEEAGKP